MLVASLWKHASNSVAREHPRSPLPQTHTSPLSSWCPLRYTINLVPFRASRSMDPNSFSNVGAGLAIAAGLLIAFALPFIAAIRAGDGFAVVGTLLLAPISLAIVILQPNVFGQVTAVLIWLGALMIGLAALYGRRVNKQPDSRNEPRPGTVTRRPEPRL